MRAARRRPRLHQLQLLALPSTFPHWQPPTAQRSTLRGPRRQARPSSLPHHRSRWSRTPGTHERRLFHLATRHAGNPSTLLLPTRRSRARSARWLAGAGGMQNRSSNMLGVAVVSVSSTVGLAPRGPPTQEVAMQTSPSASVVVLRPILQGSGTYRFGRVIPRLSRCHP